MVHGWVERTSPSASAGGTGSTMGSISTVDTAAARQPRCATPKNDCAARASFMSSTGEEDSSGKVTPAQAGE